MHALRFQALGNLSPRRAELFQGPHATPKVRIRRPIGASNALGLRLARPDWWVTQLLRQSDAQVFKKYSQMKLRMKREALEKLNRQAKEMTPAGEADAFRPRHCTQR